MPRPGSTGTPTATGSSVVAVPFVAGVDSSTQSTKVEIRDLDSGHVVGTGSAPHTAVTPPISEQDPASWWEAFEAAWDRAVASVPGGARDVTAISVAGQQHGMVALDASDQPVHPAKLWNDTESAPDAGWLLGQLGDRDADGNRITDGREAWAAAVGSVPVAAFTATKLSWLHRTHPEPWASMARVLLPHDYLTHRMTGEYTTDRGDASGTGYWSPATGQYRWDLLALIDAERDWTRTVPTVLGPLDVAGAWNGIAVAPGTGDNMAAALGLGLAPGDAALSIGTSGTAFAVSDVPTADPPAPSPVSQTRRGTSCRWCARPTPPRCSMRSLGCSASTTTSSIGWHVAAVGQSNLPVLLPYFDGERTPNRPDATGLLGGLRSDVTREQLRARRGQRGGLRDARRTRCAPEVCPIDRSSRVDRRRGTIDGTPFGGRRLARGTADVGRRRRGGRHRRCGPSGCRRRWRRPCRRTASLGSRCRKRHADRTRRVRRSPRPLRRAARRRKLMSAPDPLAELGLAPDATPDDIRSARRRLAKAHHPDRGGDAEHMQAINEAADAALLSVEASPEPHDDHASATDDHASATHDAQAHRGPERSRLGLFQRRAVVHCRGAPGRDVRSDAGRGVVAR